MRGCTCARTVCVAFGFQPQQERLTKDDASFGARGDGMGTRVVPIEGHNIEISEEAIALDQLLFDESNPRIQFQLDTALNDAPPTQESLGFALTVGNDDYERLKDNIEMNRGVLNPVWVVKDNGGYRVIEGNTRVQVLRDLRKKHPHDPVWTAIPAFVLSEACSRDQINFIRLNAHLFGTTPWDAYEKARELYRLNTEDDYSFERLSRLTKMGVSEIRTSIQAFRDMAEKYLPAFPAPGEAQKFSYFVEFRKNAELKRLVSDGKLNLLDFCNWVGEGKFRRGEDVRRLAPILKDPEARKVFEEVDFAAGLDQLAQSDPTVKSPLFDKIADVIDGLDQMPWGELDEIRRGFAPRKVDLLKDLHAKSGHFLDGLKS